MLLSRIWNSTERLNVHGCWCRDIPHRALCFLENTPGEDWEHFYTTHKMFSLRLCC
jgi:hypothetical protein